MSLTVIELSAIFVDRIILRSPTSGEQNTALCSSLETDECSGKIFHFATLSLKLKLKKFFFS